MFKSYYKLRPVDLWKHSNSRISKIEKNNQILLSIYNMCEFSKIGLCNENLTHSTNFTGWYLVKMERWPNNFKKQGRNRREALEYCEIEEWWCAVLKCQQSDLKPLWFWENWWQTAWNRFPTECCQQLIKFAADVIVEEVCHDGGERGKGGCGWRPAVWQVQSHI